MSKRALFSTVIDRPSVGYYGPTTAQWWVQGTYDDMFSLWLYGGVVILTSDTPFSPLCGLTPQYDLVRSFCHKHHPPCPKIPCNWRANTPGHMGMGGAYCGPLCVLIVEGHFWTWWWKYKLFHKVSVHLTITPLQQSPKCLPPTKAKRNTPKRHGPPLVDPHATYTTLFYRLLVSSIITDSDLSVPHPIYVYMLKVPVLGQVSMSGCIRSMWCTVYYSVCIWHPQHGQKHSQNTDKMGHILTGTKWCKHSIP